ncbi:MAG: hypothetical protein MUC63_01635, partial [Planctomycetes bacterium]|nr:hypothetical protein [Planctomycetota bacterium]
AGSIKKHKNDVFRLFQVLAPDSVPALPETIKRDLTEFTDRMRTEEVALKLLGIRAATKDEILKELRASYRLA